jgi:hypothetical protein
MRAARLDQDDVVELEALHLLDLGDLDAGREREVLVTTWRARGTSLSTRPLAVERAELARRRQHGDRREPLALRELLQRLGEEGDARAVIGEAEELDRRPSRTVRSGVVVLAERPEDAGGEVATWREQR